MASKSETRCDPCSRVDRNNPAVKFCRDCEDHLCEECVVVHKSIKMLMCHHVVNLEAAASLPSSLISKTCSKHPDYQLDFYCTFHDVMCCKSCIPADHRTCEKVYPLEEAAKDIKTSALCLSVSDDLKQMQNALDDTISNRKSNIKKVKEDSENIPREISSFKESIIASLNSMEKSALAKLSSLKDTITRKLQGETTDAENMKTKLDEYWRQLQILLENGSNNQIFILLQHIKSDINERNCRIKEFISNLEDYGLSHKRNDVLVNEKDFVSLEIAQGVCPVQYKGIQHATAQSSRHLWRVPREFKLETNVKVENIVYGMAPDENKLILTLIELSELQVYTGDGEFVNQVALAENAFDIAYEDQTGKIATTLWDGRVQIIENLNVISTITVPGGRSFGVEWVNDKLFVGGRKQIFGLNRNLKHVNTISVSKEECIYYIHCRNDKVYVSDYYSVYCIKEDGTNVFTFNSPDLRGVYGIVTDSKGNVYVAGRNSDNIHRLSTDGTQSEVIIKGDDGICGPIAICFSKDYQKLFVSNGNNNTVSIFNCEY